MTLLVCGKPGTAGAQALSYTDSLWVRLGDSVVVAATDGTADKYLEFSVFIMRPNSNWNIGGGAKDTLLGNVDFYYSYNKDAFDGYPSFLPVTHSAVDFSAGGTGNGSLEGKAFENAGRMLISLRKKLPEVNGRDLFKISQREWIQVCRMKWKLKKDGTGAYQANLNVAWDRPATGLMTFGGYPIIDTLVGSIMKNPDPTLRIINESPSPVWACEGGGAQFVTTAESSGDALRYIWYDSIPGTTVRPGWKEIVRTPADPSVPSANPHVNSRGEYRYSINGLGDTLSLLDVPGRMDSIFVKCVVDDASIGMAISSGAKRLMVRDSIRVFLSAGKKSVAGIVDTVTKCAGAPAYFRVNVSGIAESELLNKDEMDTVFVTCRFINDEGNRGEKYLKVIPDQFKRVSNTTIGGYPVFYWEFSIDTVGKFYISGMSGSVTTGFCDNGRALWSYDTVIIKEGTHLELPKMTASVGEEITLDQDNDDNHLGSTALLSVSNKNSNLGRVLLDNSFPNPYPITYKANNSKSGLDTVVYKVTGGGCEMTREVEVIDKKYLSLKVLLAGPYLEKDRLGQDTMNRIFPGYFPTTAMGFVSPYNSNEVVKDLPKLAKGTICDWIYIRLRDGNRGNYVDSVSAFLRQDGVVCDAAGNPYLSFKNLPNNSYYIVIEHRNHVGIMSAGAINLTSTPLLSGVSTGNGVLNADFTVLGNINALPGASNFAAYCTTTGAYAMWPSDFTINGHQDGIVTTADLVFCIMQRLLEVGSYINGDVNFDSATTTADITRTRVILSGGVSKQY